MKSATLKRRDGDHHFAALSVRSQVAHTTPTDRFGSTRDGRDLSFDRTHHQGPLPGLTANSRSRPGAAFCEGLVLRHPPAAKQDRHAVTRRLMD